MSSIRTPSELATNSHKRPHGSPVSTMAQPPNTYADDPSSKRQKTVRTYTSLSSTVISVTARSPYDTSGPNPPQDFSPAVSSFEVPLQPDSRVPVNVLPADFFGKPEIVSLPALPTTSSTHHVSSKPDENRENQKDLHDDEWAAFEAEIAQVQTESALPETSAVASVIIAAPVLNGQNDTSGTADEEVETRQSATEADWEDAQNKLVEEFEQMENLEERVKRLKEKREALRTKAKTAAPVPMEVVQTTEDGDDESDEEEDDWIHLIR